MRKYIAERLLIAESMLNGERKDIIIRVGMPYWIKEGELAGCSVQFEGLFSEFGDRKGVDLLQALQIASDIDIFLAAKSDEFNFFWPTGESYNLDVAKSTLSGA